MNLTELGWNEFHEKNFNELKSENIFPARVAKAEREKYRVYSAFGKLAGDITGKLRFNAGSRGDFPVVGDWVMAEMKPEGGAAIISGILPRMNSFSRKAAGDPTDEQVLVANVDTVFLVNGLDGDYNLRRIERYLALALESNAWPVIILNKTDACRDVPARIAEVESVALGVPVIALSALKNEGVDKTRQYVTAGATVAFLGSSGTGKSTLINRLLGKETLKTGAVRASDSRGMHVTTSREMMLLPGGGIVIDNPGLRELQLWMDEGALDTTFTDIKEIAERCKFGDCEHGEEPGCAVRGDIASGSLDGKRLQGYLKLKRELRYLATRKEAKARNVKVIFEKKISRLSKQIQADRTKNRY